MLIVDSSIKEIDMLDVPLSLTRYIHLYTFQVIQCLPPQMCIGIKCIWSTQVKLVIRVE